MNQESEYSEVAARVFAGEHPGNPLDPIGHDLLGEFKTAQTLRIDLESRWLSDLRQYKGLYEPEELAVMTGRSQAFLRKTRVKVESVDARMMDLLFPANRERNYDVQSTPEPSLPTPMIEKLKALLTQQANGQPPDKDTLKAAIKAAADTAAAKMGTRIDDQLAECKYRDVARQVLHSGNLYGTGILKGPLVERRERVCYAWDDKEGRFKQTVQSFAAPFLSHVPIWQFYPDMAVTRLEDARFVWEHHRLSRNALAELATRKTFNGEAIRNHIRTAPDGDIRLMTYEQPLRAMGEQWRLQTTNKTGQFDVYERWGWLDADQLAGCGVDVPEESMHESYFANVWLLPDGTVIKAVLAPIEGVRWPYHLYYLDHDETSIFGDGLASIMRDDQKMLNASIRMLLDNGAITAGPQYEVYVPAFPANADLTSIFPHKIWPRTGGDMQYPAVRPIDANAHMPELIQVMQIFDANADEVTAIPKFTYGDNPRQGAAGTMGGLSMLLAQANIALKDFVVSWDEGVTKPFVTALYHWNMRFSSDDTIKGDYDVVAKGASSLVAKEVRGQALSQFAAMLQPEQRAYIKWADLTEQMANTQDLAGIVMSKEEALQQQQSPEFQQQQQMQQMQMQLQLAQEQAKLAEIQARTGKLDAEALNRKLEAMYAAMQAAGIAVQQPGIAQAADLAMQSAGWQDATPQQPGTGFEAAQGQPVQQQQPMQQPASPHEGQREGIETPEIQL